MTYPGVLPFFSGGGGYPVVPPTRDEILGLDGRSSISFQGLVVNTQQFGTLPGFEACIAWLTPSDRSIWWNTKHTAGDTHAIIQLPFGPPLYDEPNQPYSADRFPGLDWTNSNTRISDDLPLLIRSTIGSGFNRIFLFLGGDGPNNYPIADKQLDLLAQNNDYYHNLYKYCIIMPGWDSVFYGWEPSGTIIPAWAAHFRSIWPTGYLGLEHGTGHIPLGEGGDDYKPGGRMRDFDIILSEYDQNLHQDSCWQINGRLTHPYNRPSDQPSGDDPTPPFYLSTPNARGMWGHCAFENGEYEFVHFGLQNLPAAVQTVQTNRAYQKAMGCQFCG